LVVFSMSNTTGGGETISPVATLTSSTTSGGLGLGEARATFTSGTQSSTGGGVVITATVVTNPSLSAATAINIGGTAGSIVIGQSTKIAVFANDTMYELPMSVVVADSTGNAMPSTAVNLSLWPVAWNNSSAPCSSVGGFWIKNEDVNENLFLDSGEDGARISYPDGGALGAGTADGLLTPVNSAAGTVPAKVTTDSKGVATFSLTYPKSSAIWTAVRLRAKTIVQGTESLAELIFQLSALEGDVTTCRLVNPYEFSF
jgi:hypothetical protein